MSSDDMMETNDDTVLENDEVEDGELVEDNDDTVSDKLILRAKRFGLKKTDINHHPMNPKITKLLSSMGVSLDTRKEALHLHGTETMKTHDMFAYFSGYSPASIEWICDNSCNVVWLDEESCAKALLNLSIPIKGQLSPENEISDETGDGVHLEDIRCALPPGIWRKAQPHSLAPNLFMRFATCNDKKGKIPANAPVLGNSTYNRSLFLDEGDEVSKKPKVETGNPWSDIATQWRNYETRSGSNVPVQDAREVIRNKVGKRPKMMPDMLLRNEYHFESEPKVPPQSIRKMQADIEEKKIMERNKNIKERKNIKLPNIRERMPESDLRNRLGRKRKRDDFELEEDSGWDDKKREDVSLRIEIDNSGDNSDREWEDCHSDKGSDSDEVFSRPHTDDLRSKLEKKKSSYKHGISSNAVLRTRYINSSKKGNSFSPLRIEIDNDVCNRSDDD